MKMHWELEAISEPHDTGKWTLIDLIESMSPLPGILLFGVDSGWKDDFCELFRKWRGRFLHYIILNGEDSCSHNARHDAVEELKKAGVNSVVGVYIKIPDSYPDDSPELMRQKAILNSNPPTPDGLAFLFTIVEDERD